MTGSDAENLDRIICGQNVVQNNPQPIRFKDARGCERKLIPRAGQPLVWVAITPRSTLRDLRQADGKLLDSCVALPFLIDTGCSETVVCHSHLFEKWLYADVSRNSSEFETLGSLNLNGLPCQKICAHAWLFKSVGDGFVQPNIATDEAIKLEVFSCVISRIDSGKDYENHVEGNKSSRPRRGLKGLVNFFASGRSDKNNVAKAVDDYINGENPFPRVPVIGTKALMQSRFKFELDNLQKPTQFSISRKARLR